MFTPYLQRPQGLSLIELIVVVAVIVMLASLAIPSYSAFVVNSRLNAIANEWVSAIHLARSEAVRRGQHVVIRKVGAEWENGWQLFVDVERSTATSKNVFDSSTDLELRVSEPLPISYSLRGNNNFQNYIRYQPDGTSNTIGSFVVCKDQSVKGAKLIIINSTGRIRVASDSDQDGIPEKDNNSELASCTTGF